MTDMGLRTENSRLQLRRIMIAVGLTSLFAVLTVLFIWRDDIISIFSNEEGIKPSADRAWIFVGLLVMLGIVVAILASTIDEMKADYLTRLEKARADASPPKITPETPAGTALAPVAGTETAPAPLTPKQKMVAAYEAREFEFDSRLSDDPNAPEVWVGPEVPDADDLERTEGVVIYENGNASQFSVGLLHADDFWNFGDVEHVVRKTNKRPVAIKTALNRPALKKLFATNDYILAVGLASSLQTAPGERSEKISVARGYNLGLAILETKSKELDRIRAVSFGYAKEAPRIPELEPRQRSVMVVGVNASRAVVVDDIMAATARIVKLDGVRFGNYSSGGAYFIKVRDIDPATGYMKADEVNILEGSDREPMILEAVGSAK